MAILTAQQVRDEGYGNPPYTDARVTAAIKAMDAYIEELTGNWFEPRTLTLKLDGTGHETLFIPHPIIEITEIRIDGDVVAAADYLVYNRHLTGQTRPDDRQNPKVEFKGTVPMTGGRTHTHRHTTRQWPDGRLNIEVDGKFGYRDYDKDNPSSPDPEGVIPENLQAACLLLMDRFLEQGATPYNTDAWRKQYITKQSSRGQSVEFKGAMGDGKVFGVLTGDVLIDTMLAPYVRPEGIHTV